MKIDLACWERGCPCYDQNEGVDVVRREWVGLTDEERDQAEECCWYMDEFDPTIYAENIEAKLKEKNT